MIRQTVAVNRCIRCGGKFFEVLDTKRHKNRYRLRFIFPGEQKMKLFKDYS